MKIGFLGPKGTFSQQAVLSYVKDSNDEIIEYPNINELILAVEDKVIDEAVVPIENSIEGSVNITLDILAHKVNLKIKTEIIIPIEHNLLVKPGTKNISFILSHPQAIGQCREFINKNFPHATIKYTYSTAQAAQQIAEGIKADDYLIVEKEEDGYAAISAVSAAREYGLEIIHRSIQDFNSNYTRFIVLSHKDAIKSNKNKTSIIFSTENKPGSLYKILQILDLWDINMTKIESRPAKDILGSYIFFVDMEGHYKDEDVNDALTMIKRKTTFFKFLGSYATMNLSS